MATIRREISVATSAQRAWDAVRDVGAVHRRLVPGVLTDTTMEPGARTVTFANGMVIRERIVDVDDAARRLVWSATGGRLEHHNASLQVLEDGEGRCRLVWIADLLPDAVTGDIGALMDLGAAAMKRALDGG